MRIPALCFAVLCLAGPLSAQGPRVPRFETLAGVPASWQPQPDAYIGLRWPREALSKRRSYWLEGGIIGGALFGLVGTQFCGMGNSRADFGCYAKAFAFIGGCVGFPVGVLIGGRFPKRAREDSNLRPAA